MEGDCPPQPRPSVLPAPGSIHDYARRGLVVQIQHLLDESRKEGIPEGIILASREPVLGSTPLHVACEHGQLEVVQVGGQHVGESTQMRYIYQKTHAWLIRYLS
jgi:hypothetical protein